MSPQNAEDEEDDEKVEEIQAPIIFTGPKKPRIPLDIKTKMKEERLNAYQERVRAARAAGVPIEPYEDEEEDEDDEAFVGCLEQDLLYRNTLSFRCLAQVSMSSSSLLRSVEYNFPPVSDPGIEDAMNYIEPGIEKDDIGLHKFVELSKRYKVAALRRVKNSLATSVMNLKFYGLRRFQMKCLMEALQTNRFVEHLILQDNFLTAEMSRMLGKMTAANSMIKILNVKHCNIGPQGAAKLGDLLARSQSISDLDISYNNLGDEGLKHLENGFGEMISLMTLNLSHNNLTADSAEYLETILNNSKTLSELDVSWNRLASDESYDIIFNAIAQSDRLRFLNLSNNGFCADIGVFMVFTSYLQQTAQLQELDLSWNRMPAGKFIKELRKGVLVNQSLRILKLGFNPWTPEEAFPLTQLIALCPNLQILDMENIWFTKRVKRVILNAEFNNKTIIIGGIYQNWEIKGPNMTELIWKRIRAIYLAPKKAKKKQEFGHFLLNLPDGPMKRSQFEEILRKMRYQKLVEDVELAEALYAIYTKERQLDTFQMIKDYLDIFPHCLQGDVGKKKKKKGKKSSKGSSKVTLSRSSIKKSKSSLKGSKSSVVKSHVSIVEGESEPKSSKELLEVLDGSRTRIGSKVSIKDSKEKVSSLVAIQEEEGDTEASTDAEQSSHAEQSEDEVTPD